MTEFVTIKGSKGDYKVTAESCTCPDYIYRKKDLGEFCKHIKQLRGEKNE